MPRISSIRRWWLLGALAIAGCQDEPTSPAEPGTGPGPDGPSLVMIPSSNVFTQLDAGWSHTCAVRGDGVIECWGDNSVGEGPATKAAAIGTFTQVSAAAVHTCAVRSDGVVECWGDNGYGEAPATRSAASGTFIQVSVGAGITGGGFFISYHTCAVRSDGVIECWGSNGSGEAPPTKSAVSGSFTQVSAGWFHSCGVRDDGVVECWGSNVYGQAPATKAAVSGSFTQVSAGGPHTCAVRSDGVVECWGDNSSGVAPATRSAASGSFTQLTTAGQGTCALRTDGVVECWGLNQYGEAPATQSAASGSFTQVSMSQTHTCALRDDGVVECWGDNYFGQAPATRLASPVHLFPTATFSATPTSVALGQSFALSLANAQVPGYSGSVTFSYAFDCGDGSGYSAFGASNTAACPTTAIGTRAVNGMVQDQDGDQTEYTGSVSVIYAFGGFLGPIDAPPVFNVAKAGAAVPAKFSLGGNLGLNILAANYPKSQPIACDASSPADPIEETATAGSSGLSYDAATGQYTYVWKTDKAWANTCRLLTLRLVDGTDHTALFKFSR